MTTPKEAHELVSRWYEEGKAAAAAGISASSCPYTPGTFPHYWWCEAFTAQVTATLAEVLAVRVNLLERGIRAT